MENNFNISNNLNPDLNTANVRSRRELFSKSLRSIGMLTAAPVVLAAASTQALAAGLPAKIVGTLNFALTLEYIEAAFYRKGLSSNVIPQRYRTVFETIAKHEAAHVAFLSSALGGAAVKAPKIDFTAGGKYADVFSNFKTFLALSVTFEDLGVAAYKGQAGNLQGNGDILTAALQIHSVEARHAAEVRRISGKKAWKGAFDEPMSKQQVLAAAKPFLVG